MKTRTFFISLICWGTLTGAVFAQEAGQGPSDSNNMYPLLMVIPVVVVGAAMVPIVFALRRSGSRWKRYEQHMERVEKLLEDIATGEGKRD